MKDIKIGDAFTISGRRYILSNIEKDTAIVKDCRADCFRTYGVEALRRILLQSGYDIERREDK